MAASRRLGIFAAIPESQLIEEILGPLGLDPRPLPRAQAREAVLRHAC